MEHTHQGAAQTPTEERLSNMDVNAWAQPPTLVAPWITLALTYFTTMNYYAGKKGMFTKKFTQTN